MVVVVLVGWGSTLAVLVAVVLVVPPPSPLQWCSVVGDGAHWGGYGGGGVAHLW